MRIALTNPFCWPYVRRGNERIVAELAQYLVERGHEVVTVSGKPGRSIVETTSAGRRILQRYLWIPQLDRLRISPAHTFALGLCRALLSLDVDVVHSLSYVDSWTANHLRRWRGFRTVFQVTGPPVPHWFPRLPPSRYVLRRAIQQTDQCTVLTEFTARIVRSAYGVEAKVVPVAIDPDAFPLKAGPGPERPTILSVASFDERRKGLRALVEAFQIVKRMRSDAVLLLSGHMPAQVQSEIIEPLPDAIRADIQVLDLGKLEDLPRLYREASVTALPSMWEAYGMVLVESWASGTPVVVTDHGGPAELLNDPALGRKFDPMTDGQETRNAEGLAISIIEALELASDPATAQRCRDRAAEFSWDRLGPVYEGLYTPE
ncbi:MAG: glycosyltransferase family 4 protein [bacterium]|nr:glycosyltransferase family 4 protein [bacterium]